MIQGTCQRCGSALNPGGYCTGPGCIFRALDQTDRLHEVDPYRIDPKRVDVYVQDEETLQRFWLFCIFVAGKNADQMSDKLSRLLRLKPSSITPLDFLRESKTKLDDLLRDCRTGQYSRIMGAITESSHLDLETVTLEELEQVHGVGFKTARYFLLYSRPGFRGAVLDTHILKWLDQKGVKNVPLSTPSNPKEYKRLEEAALSLYETHFPGMSPRDCDLLIWSIMSGRLKD